MDLSTENGDLPLWIVKRLQSRRYGIPPSPLLYGIHPSPLLYAAEISSSNQFLSLHP
uniref:Uncharacterized protein n=1 Tax=Zea mays TaxID=4577 RepID=B4FVY9_MAIZE|nr:unknown [Zea mays]